MTKPTPKEIVESALIMAQAILDSNALPNHKRDFLRGCVWLVTEANGKYDVPYWSEGVYMLVQTHGDIKSALRHGRIQHEHVYPRKHIAEQIMNDPTCLRDVMLKQSVACLVTKEEHDKLKNTNDGFARYKLAGIRVWDVQAQDWYSLLDEQ
jgi:hypothetical protein